MDKSNENDNDKLINILLIEDDPLICQFVPYLLEESKSILFTIETKNTLQEGIDRLSTGNIDVVLLDLGLPDSFGINTFTSIYKKFPEIPFIVLTVSKDQKTISQALQGGAQDYLVKDNWNNDLLIRSIQYSIERKKSELDSIKKAKELKKLNSQLMLNNEKLEQLSLSDSLTDMLNRRGLQNILTYVNQSSTRTDSPSLAILIDIDNFKKINDTLGHSVGDVVLKEISSSIKNALRKTDYIGRIGGDEFLVIAPNTRWVEKQPIAEKIRLSISKSKIALISNKELEVTASLGIVKLSNDVTSIDEILDRTHILLKQCKNTGKNKISFSLNTHQNLSETEPDYMLKIVNKLTLYKNLRTVAHPIIDLETEEKCGYEVLIRSTIKGFESPDYFFQICQENNILTTVDHNCMKQCAQHAYDSKEKTVFNINIFPSTLINVPYQQLIDIFKNPDFKGKFCIEISEKQIIGDPFYLQESINAFKNNGVLIALDDVGFGHSCLEALIFLEPDIIKIDKSCMNNLSKNKWRIRPLKRLMKISKTLNAEVIAEGIENKEDFEEAKNLGIKKAQGYYWGKPS